MGNITIYQGQSVIFTDTTSGGVTPYASHLWSFPGGSPASGTGSTASVVYGNPGDYSVSLKVTDSAGVSSSSVQTNLVDVQPAYVNSSFSLSAARMSMDSSITFTDTSTGQPTAPTSWSWTIGASSGITTQNVTYGYSDWADVPGVNLLASPGSAATVSVQLTASTATSTSVSNNSFQVLKKGPIETFYINNDGINPITTYVNESPIYWTNRRTSQFGLPGDELIYEIRPGASGSRSQRIRYFHASTEVATLQCTGFATSSFMSSPTGSALFEDLFIAINGSLYTTGPASASAGEYITGFSTDRIFFAVPNEITDLYDNYNFPAALIGEIIGNPYPMINSTQSRIRPGFRFPTNSSSTTYDPVVPSSQYFSGLGIPGTTYYTATFEVEYLSSGPSTVNVTFDANGGVGNDSTGDFYVMQDSGAGDGVATMLNTEFGSQLPGGTSDMLATALRRFNVDPNGTSSTYYGIKIEVLNPDIIGVIITDNASTLDPLAQSLGGEALPFGFDGSNSKSCTGMLNTFVLSEYLEGGSFLQIGGDVV